MILILIIALIIEAVYSPRLDYTHNDQLLLWYGKKKREFFIIFDNS